MRPSRPLVAVVLGCGVAVCAVCAVCTVCTTAAPPSGATPPAGATTAAQRFAAGTWLDLTHSFDATTIYWPTEKGFLFEAGKNGPTPQGYYYAANRFATAEHGGTHLDAPRHFAEGRRTADQIEPWRLVGEAAVIDVAQKCAAIEVYDWATMVQFSSAFCTPCRATHALLSQMVQTMNDVKHIQVDAESLLELVRELDIRSTPTTIFINKDGIEVGRAAGTPKREQVLEALEAIR